MGYATSDQIVIACAADDNYAMPLAVTLRSILENLKPDRSLLVFVLDGGITTSSKAKISRSLDAPNLKIEWIKPSESSFQNLPVSKIYPISIYYRLLLPQIIPPSIEKIIYLDTDLVVERDLGQLWDLELGDRFVLAVQDPYHRYLSSETHRINAKELGIPSDSKYFNSGILVINLQKWRSEKVAEQAIEFIQNHPEQVLYPDQDALNVVVADRWGELDPRWNQVHVVHEYQSWQDSPYSESVYEQVLRDPYVIHYTVSKPWETNHTNPEKERFFRYLDRTAWRGWRNTAWRRAWRKARRLIYRQSVGY